MTVDNIIALARTNTKTTTAQVSAANAVIWLSAIHFECVAAITQFVSEDFFFDIWVTDALASQENGEYTFPEQNGENAGMEKLKRLEVKPTSTDLYHIPATQVDVRSLPYAWSWYLTNQPASDPIYWVADKSFFLAPDFTSDSAGDAGNEQLKLFGIKQPVDLASGGAEATILVPRTYHHRVLALGLESFIYRSLQKHKEAAKSFQDYTAAKNLMISELSDRDISEGIMTLPPDQHLQ